MQEKKQINVEIGARIKEEPEKAGLTQERFSELIGLGSKSVSAFERGTVGISFTTLKKLSKRLERLSPRQYAIAKEIVLKLLEAFSLEE